jgi:serine/threonine protein kinase
MVWQSGQTLYGGRYLIERYLGQANFGITYLASHKNSDRAIVKTVSDRVLTHPDYAEFWDNYRRNFDREATKLALCRHPHIVQIDNIFYEESLPCIAMEDITGENLWKYVKYQGVLPEIEALRYIQQIGAALTLLHDKGLLHRDLNPHNIKVRSGVSEVVLIDFGIARDFIADVPQDDREAFSQGFTPIEQYDREAKRGEFTDVYALAATLYFLLTGKVPTPASLRLVWDSLVPPKHRNPRISNTVNQAILQGMALQPEHRPQSVQEWLNLLGINPQPSQSIPAVAIAQELITVTEKPMVSLPTSEHLLVDEKEKLTPDIPYRFALFLQQLNFLNDQLERVLKCQILSVVRTGLGVGGIIFMTFLGFWLGQNYKLKPQASLSQRNTSALSISQPNSQDINLTTADTSIVTDIAIKQLKQDNIAAGQKAVEELLNRGELQPAHAALDVVSKSQLDRSALLFLKGRLAWQFVNAGSKDYDWHDARRYWEFANKREPKSSTYLTALGFAYYTQGNFEQAQEAWFNALLLIQESNVKADRVGDSTKKEALNAYAGLALVLRQQTQNQPADKQTNLLTKSLEMRQYVMTNDPANFQPEALSHNWVWSEKAIQDWRSLLAISN